MKDEDEEGRRRITGYHSPETETESKHEVLIKAVAFAVVSAVVLALPPLSYPLSAPSQPALPSQPLAWRPLNLQGTRLVQGPMRDRDMTFWD